ncbi:MAG: polysulfide reductase NrfD [Acidisphaera sp.]|nr:polysulfide reductase NrfD [Acidisphaera sp.]
MSTTQLPMQPVVDPAESPGAMTDRIAAIVLRERAYLWWWLLMIPSATLAGVMVVSILWLFYAGIGIWGIDWPVVWGFAIINYVWWIGIASGGTFISALFFLVRVEWRTSLNRLAESMTLFAAACAGIYPILHLGRPWFFYWLFPYPNTMTLWPQFRSPLFWDFCAILAYVVSSILFWYLGAIPDFATMRDTSVRRRPQLFYGVLALGFRGSGREWRNFRAAYAVLAAIMAPMVCSVHSIVGLDFAAAQTTGWHSTQFPPFFVFGAVLSGFGMVLFLALPLRRLLRLEAFITGRHLEVLARLLLVSSLCVIYAYMMDAFSTYYGAEPAEKIFFHERVTGLYAGVYWSTLLLNCVLPQLLWWRRLRLNQALVWLISSGVIVGMWLERYGIVVVSLHRPKLPSAWGNFTASIWDWALFAGTVGFFFAGLLVVVRLVPIISIFEMREILRKRQA